MSAVINRAKQQYRKALLVEIVLILGLSLVMWGFKGYLALSFGAGSLASFIPHCVFVYWIFFKESAKNRTKMTAFYRGEGLKWCTTILLVIACLKLIPSLHLVLFFVGYFMALVLNNVIPFVLTKRTH